jgi:polar amino acid transport system substrate-binding protein
MKSLHILLVVFLSAVVAFGTAATMNKSGAPATSNTRESAYDRVMRTGTLRCGYIQYPMFIERDLKTGKFSGIYYEMMEEIGKRLSLKIDWAAEVGFADVFDGLKMGRYDVVCFALNQTPGRARATEFTVPALFGPSFIYVRADDSRFDNDYGKINSPDIKMAFMEGELTQTIRNEDFPKTQAVSLTSLADVAQVLMQVATGKADAAITEPSSAEAFMLNNPGKLKRVPGPPVRMQQVGVDVAVGEHSLRRLLDTTIQSLLATGFMERTMNKYVTAPDQLYLPAKPWGESAHPVK